MKNIFKATSQPAQPQTPNKIQPVLAEFVDLGFSESDFEVQLHSLPYVHIILSGGPALSLEPPYILKNNQGKTVFIIAQQTPHETSLLFLHEMSKLKSEAGLNSELFAQVGTNSSPSRIDFNRKVDAKRRASLIYVFPDAIKNLQNIGTKTWQEYEYTRGIKFGEEFGTMAQPLNFVNEPEIDLIAASLLGRRLISKEDDYTYHIYDPLKNGLKGEEFIFRFFTPSHLAQIKDILLQNSQEILRASPSGRFLEIETHTALPHEEKVSYIYGLDKNLNLIIGPSNSALPTRIITRIIHAIGAISYVHTDSYGAISYEEIISTRPPKTEVSAEKQQQFIGYLQKLVSGRYEISDFSFDFSPSRNSNLCTVTHPELGTLFLHPEVFFTTKSQPLPSLLISDYEKEESFNFLARITEGHQKVFTYFQRDALGNTESRKISRSLILSQEEADQIMKVIESRNYDQRLTEFFKAQLQPGEKFGTLDNPAAADFLRIATDTAEILGRTLVRYDSQSTQGTRVNLQSAAFGLTGLMELNVINSPEFEQIYHLFTRLQREGKILNLKRHQQCLEISFDKETKVYILGIKQGLLYTHPPRPDKKTLDILEEIGRNYKVFDSVRVNSSYSLLQPFVPESAFQRPVKSPLISGLETAAAELGYTLDRPAGKPYYELSDDEGKLLSLLYPSKRSEAPFILNCTPVKTSAQEELKALGVKVFEQMRQPLFLAGLSSVPEEFLSFVQAPGHSVAIVTSSYLAIDLVERMLDHNLCAAEDLTIPNGAMWQELKEYLKEQYQHFSPDAKMGMMGVKPLNLTGFELMITPSEFYDHLLEISKKYHTPLFITNSDRHIIFNGNTDTQLSVAAGNAFQSFGRIFRDERVDEYKKELNKLYPSQFLADFTAGLAPQQRYFSYWLLGGNTESAHFLNQFAISSELLTELTSNPLLTLSEQYLPMPTPRLYSLSIKGRDVSYYRILDPLTLDDKEETYRYRALALTIMLDPDIDLELYPKSIAELITQIELISELGLWHIKEFRNWAIKARNKILRTLYDHAKDNYSSLFLPDIQKLTSEGMFDALTDPEQFRFDSRMDYAMSLYTLKADRQFWTSFDKKILTEDLASKAYIKPEELNEQKSKIQLPSFSTFSPIGRMLAETLLEHRSFTSKTNDSLFRTKNSELHLKEKERIEKELKKQKRQITNFMAEYEGFAIISPTKKEITDRQSTEEIHAKLQRIVKFMVETSRRLPDTKLGLFINSSEDLSEDYGHNFDKLLDLPFVRWLISLSDQRHYAEQLLDIASTQPENVWLMMKYLVFAFSTKQIFNPSRWVYNFLAQPLGDSFIAEHHPGLVALIESLSPATEKPDEIKPESDEQREYILRMDLFKKFQSAEKLVQQYTPDLTGLKSLIAAEKLHSEQKLQQWKTDNLLDQLSHVETISSERAISSNITLNNLKPHEVRTVGSIIHNGTRYRSLEQPISLSDYKSKEFTTYMIGTIDRFAMKDMSWKTQLKIPKDALVEMQISYQNPIFPRDLNWTVSHVYAITTEFGYYDKYEVQQGELGEIYLPPRLLGKPLLVVQTPPRKWPSMQRIDVIKSIPKERCEFIPQPDEKKLGEIKQSASHVFGHQWAMWVKDVRVRKQENLAYTAEELQKLVTKIANILYKKIFSKAYYDFDFFALNGLDPEDLEDTHIFNLLVAGNTEGVYCDVTAISVFSVLSALFGHENVHYVLSRNDKFHNKKILTKVNHIRVLVGNVQLDLTPSKIRFGRSAAIKQALDITPEDLSSVNLLTVWQELRDKVRSSLIAPLQARQDFGDYLIKEIGISLNTHQDAVQQGLQISQEINENLNAVEAPQRLEAAEQIALTDGEEEFIRSFDLILALGDFTPSEIFTIIQRLRHAPRDQYIIPQPISLPLENPDALVKLFEQTKAKVLDPETFLITIPNIYLLSEIVVFLMANQIKHDGAIDLADRIRLFKDSTKPAESNFTHQEGIPTYQTAKDKTVDAIVRALVLLYQKNADFEDLLAYITKTKTTFGTYHAKEQYQVGKLKQSFTLEQRQKLRQTILETNSPVVVKLAGRFL